MLFRSFVTWSLVLFLYSAVQLHHCNTFSLSVTNPARVCAALCVWHPFTVHYSTSSTGHMACPLDPKKANQSKQKWRRRKKTLTFRWSLQFPPPSFLAWRGQALVLVFLRVLLFTTGKESVLLGEAPALNLGVVLCPARGRVPGDPILHFPLLLFWEAGIGHPVSVPAHVSIVDLCHGRPTHPSVAVAHTHAVFKRSTALDLQASKEEVVCFSLMTGHCTTVLCSCQQLWHITWYAVAGCATNKTLEKLQQIVQHAPKKKHYSEQQ